MNNSEPLAKAWVEVTAPLGRLRSDIVKARTIISAGTALMQNQAKVQVSADTKPLEKGLGRAKELTKALIDRAITLPASLPRTAANFNALQASLDAAGLSTDRMAEITIEVGQDTLKAGLAAAGATLKAGVRAMTKIALVPLSLTHFAFKTGLALAQGALIAGVSRMTGLGVVPIFLALTGFKVGLKVAEKLLVSATRMMVRVALIPIRVALGALKIGLRLAKSMVSAAVRSMASVAVVPLKMASGMIRSILSTGGAALGMAGLIGAPAAIAAITKEASDLEESTSKVGFAFKTASKIIINGSDDMARRLGIPKREFIDAAAAIGLIGKAAKLSNEAAAKLGVDFAKLGADAASFYNIPLDLALEKIRSGLVGESEPLRTLGVLLSETAVQTEALRLKLVANKKDLTEGHKVMARASLIASGLSDATGDLARTQDSLANRLREVWGRVKNLAAAIGAYLLPAARSLSRTLAEIATGVAAAVERNSGLFKEWGRSLEHIADYVGVIYRNFSKFKEIVGLVFVDVGKYLLSSIKSAFDNLINYAVYFGKVVGQKIEEAITTALHNAFPKMVAKWQQRVHFLPPQWKNAAFQANPGIQQGLNQVAGLEGVRKLANGAKDAANQMLGFIGKAKAVLNKEDPALHPAGKAAFAVLAGADDAKKQARLPMRVIERQRAEQLRKAEASELAKAKREKESEISDLNKKVGAGQAKGATAEDKEEAEKAKARLEFIKEQDDIDRAKNKKERADISFVGIEDFVKQIQLGALGKNRDDAALKTSKNTDRMALTLERIERKFEKKVVVQAVAAGPE